MVASTDRRETDGGREHRIAGGLKESFLVSNTYHNTHTLSQGTPSLHRITSNHNTVSRKAPTQGRNISIPVRNSSTPGQEERERERHGQLYGGKESRVLGTELTG